MPSAPAVNIEPSSVGWLAKLVRKLFAYTSLQERISERGGWLSVNWLAYGDQARWGRVNSTTARRAVRDKQDSYESDKLERAGRAWLSLFGVDAALVSLAILSKITLNVLLLVFKQ